ncbi:anthranilate synthase component I [Fibrobacterota bacterium]
MKSLEQVKALAGKGNVIPIYRELSADLETPITALLKLNKSAEQIFLLESVEGGENIARYSFLGKTPFSIFRSRGRQIHISGLETKSYQGEPLEELKAFFEKFRGVKDPNLPNFAGGGVGFITYDAVRLIERIPETGRDDLNLDDIHIGMYDAFIVFDNVKHRMYIVANVLIDVYDGVKNAYKVALNNINRLEQELSAPLIPPSPHTSANPEWGSNFVRRDFEDSVEKCREFIKAGDAFQIVLSQRFSCDLETDSIRIYRALRTINPSPYMYYLKFNELEVVGASPEMLVRVNNRKADTRPIAGSRPRGRDAEEDLQLEKDLLSDEKERAEHVMLVDLGRNDLGRVSEYGSVRVTQFMTVERYSHIMHIVSNVEGILRPEMHCLDALMACFPAGTLSGAPKIRAMEIIDELEPHKRGIYGGAICYLDFNGNLDSCIAIRTMVVKDNKALVQAGAGIVADSVPSREYEETRSKAASLFKAVEMAGEA